MINWTSWYGSKGLKISTDCFYSSYFCFVRTFKAFSSLLIKLPLATEHFSPLTKHAMESSKNSFTLRFLDECQGIGEQAENTNKLSCLYAFYGKMVFSINEH